MARIFFEGLRAVTITYNDVWGRTQNRVMLDVTITAVKGNHGAAREKSGGIS